MSGPATGSVWPITAGATVPKSPTISSPWSEVCRKAAALWLRPAPALAPAPIGAPPIGGAPLIEECATASVFVSAGAASVAETPGGAASRDAIVSSGTPPGPAAPTPPPAVGLPDGAAPAPPPAMSPAAPGPVAWAGPPCPPDWIAPIAALAPCIAGIAACIIIGAKLDAGADAAAAGALANAAGALAAAAGEGTRSKPWVEQLTNVEAGAREKEREQLDDPRAPLHPVRIYRELDQVLDRDAIVVGDGGDFVSYAGRYINTYEPGCWMDPGPFGCLGAGPGQAIGAKVAYPDRQVCLLLGDGAFGFAGMEFETMSRHGLGVVGVMGNNGIWALEHHPMKFLYGYSVAAELRPETRYDELVETLGCEGVIVREPDELRPALERAFESGRPTLVNVLTDPEVVYPRKSNLA